jgi:hypothetical protein
VANRSTILFTPTIATSGALMIGVVATPLMVPRLVMVIVDPVSSARPALPVEEDLISWRRRRTRSNGVVRRHYAARSRGGRHHNPAASRGGLPIVSYRPNEISAPKSRYL